MVSFGTVYGNDCKIDSQMFQGGDRLWVVSCFLRGRGAGKNVQARTKVVSHKET